MHRWSGKVGWGMGLLLVLAVLGWWWQHSSYEPRNFPPSARGPWIAFGDSLTAGQGAVESGDYPSILSRSLGIPIQNLGVNGATTAEALDRLEPALALQPRVLLLCLGGNDGLRRVPVDATFSNLGRIIDRFLAEGTFVVLLGVRSASLSDQFAGRFEDLAREKEVLFVPNILDGVLGKPGLMADYVHPNEHGYEVIAKRIAAKLAPLLNEGLLVRDHGEPTL